MVSYEVWFPYNCIRIMQSRNPVMFYIVTERLITIKDNNLKKVRFSFTIIEVVATNSG